MQFEEFPTEEDYVKEFFQAKQGATIPHLIKTFLDLQKSIDGLMKGYETLSWQNKESDLKKAIDQQATEFRKQAETIRRQVLDLYQEYRDHAVWGLILEFYHLDKQDK